MHELVTRTLIFRPLGELSLLVHGLVSPAADDWASYLDAIEARGRVQQQVKLLVVTDDVGPSGPQRAELARRFPRGGKTAVVGGSAVVRSIVTLIAWLDPSIRPFAMANLESALGYLDIPKTDHGAVTRHVAICRARLSGAAPSDEAADALLTQSQLEPADTVVRKLSTLRQDLVTRWRV